MTERQAMIKNELILRHRLTVKELSEKYQVSEVTIRHDLTQLEKEGYAKRIFGGALRNDSASSLISPSTQDALASALAAEARSLLSDGDCIYLGAGKTCCCLARSLKGISNLTVFTNNIAAIGDLANAGARIFLLGGELLYREIETPMTRSDDSVYQMTIPFVTKAFTSATAIDLDAGLTNDNAWQASVGKLIPLHCHEWIVMAESSCFNRISIYESARFQDITHLVSDQIPPEYASAAHRFGIGLHSALAT